jgi:predicted short-subunit dehydrogenase-like oxidoreductase (DUF2520 family)
MNIVIIGAGNVGYHLAIALQAKGYNLVQVYSRSQATLAPLIAALPNIATTTQLSQLATADVYLIAVKDDSIETVANQIIVPPNSIVAHTSGTVLVDVLQKHTHYGIFYPLQTMRQSQTVDWQQVPFCIHANTPQTQHILFVIAQTLSPKVYILNDHQRQMLHLTAVMVNNFANHLFVMAHQILSNNQLPFDLLKPLILETAQKVQTQNPNSVQTGPAIRHDTQTIERHLQLLQTYPDSYTQLYQLFTKMISDSKW